MTENLDRNVQWGGEDFCQSSATPLPAAPDRRVVNSQLLSGECVLIQCLSSFRIQLSYHVY